MSIAVSEAVGSTGWEGGNGNVSGFSDTLSVGSGADFVVIRVLFRGSGVTLTAATYNSGSGDTSMTVVQEDLDAGGLFQLWFLSFPCDAGDGDYDIDLSFSSTNRAAWRPESYTTGDDYDFETGFLSDGTSAETSDLTVTGMASGDYAIDQIAINNPTAASLTEDGADSTEDFNAQEGPLFFGGAHATNITSSAFGWSWTTNRAWGHSAINIVEVAGGGGTPIPVFRQHYENMARH